MKKRHGKRKSKMIEVLFPLFCERGPDGFAISSIDVLRRMKEVIPSSNAGLPSIRWYFQKIKSGARRDWGDASKLAPSRPRSLRPTNGPRDVPHARVVAPPVDITIDADAERLVSGKALSIHELTADSCRWPLWTQAASGGLYCAELIAPAAQGETRSSFCVSHQLRAVSEKSAAVRAADARHAKALAALA